jgi:fatty-acid desaturase
MDQQIDKRNILTAIQLIGPFVVLWALVQYATLAWVATAMIMLFLMRIVGGSIFYHRILCHHTHDVHPAVEIIGTTLGFYGSFMPPADFCITHFNHHKYADTEQDPHCHSTQGWKTMFPILWNITNQVDFRTVIRLRKNKIVNLFSEKYWLMASLPLLLLLISLEAFLFLFLIPCTLSIWSAAISTMNHDENGAKNMGFWYGIVSGAEHKHKNHHNDISDEGWINIIINLIAKKRVKT